MYMMWVYSIINGTVQECLQPLDRGLSFCTSMDLHYHAKKVKEYKTPEGYPMFYMEAFDPSGYPVKIYG